MGARRKGKLRSSTLECEDNVTQEKLWAPWRLSYVSTTQDDGGCFLCRYAKGGPESDPENHVVLRSEHSFITLNRFPYNNGHLLVAPLAHKGTLSELDDAELLDGVHQLQRMCELMTPLLRADGFNIGLNLGPAAGAGVPGHLHWHIVPRWNGDTNFMPVTADTKVISQSLEALYTLLRGAITD